METATVVKITVNHNVILGDKNVKANQKMIDTCDFLISYVVHGASNARNLLEYAERQQKKGRIHVINLGVPREQFTPS